MKKIKVHLDKKVSMSYDICIGYDVIDRIGLIIAKNHKATHYVIITDSNVSRLYGGTILGMFQNLGLRAVLVEFPAGEASKNIHTALNVVGQMLKLGADRNSVLIALGGGVVGDIVGFIASVYMRSVPYIQMPTTLMAQVDSSIGGKTAIDLPDGKNLLGTFYQPKAVFVDLKFLETLSKPEFNNGLAEIVKYGIIDDLKFFLVLEEKMNAIKNQDEDVLLAIVEHSCRVKKGIVEIDEKDQGIRRILNFGHTVGHAVEATSGYTISHGNAVAMGMIAAVQISGKSYGLSIEERERIRQLIDAFGLPCYLPSTITTDDIIAKLKVDKKKEGDKMHFVLLKKIGMPFVNGGVSEAMMRETIEEIKR
jgi:3-dehydroquinate synthase